MAMEWISKNVEPNASFAVITGRTWEIDYLSEWFPVIAERRSIATVQGAEWTGLEAFLRRLAAYRQLQQCAKSTATCVTDWARAWGQSAPYVFIPKGRLAGPLSDLDCCLALRETLIESDAFRVIYDRPGATILAPAEH
jgi:hypothetical protein